MLENRNHELVKAIGHIPPQPSVIITVAIATIIATPVSEPPRAREHSRFARLRGETEGSSAPVFRRSFRSHIQRRVRRSGREMPGRIERWQGKVLGRVDRTRLWCGHFLE